MCSFNAEFTFKHPQTPLGCPKELTMHFRGRLLAVVAILCSLAASCQAVPGGNSTSPSSGTPRAQASGSSGRNVGH